MTIKKIMAAALSAVLCVVLSAAAFAESLVPGGGAVGIRMTTDGVVVAGVSEVQTPNGKRSPAAEAGLKKGDVITRLGGADIGTAQDFKTALAQLDGSKTTVTIERGGKAKQLNITPAQDADGAWKLGLWLRDGVSGVGTLTFYDPETGVYGALGHSISDEATGEALPLGDGGIVQGMSGSPIIQNGKLVGAVTHVFVNDPTSGYGISIRDMLKTAESAA